MNPMNTPCVKSSPSYESHESLLCQELGLPLRVSPNFETQECQWSFGEAAPPPADDPTWPKGCVVGCTSREAMRELNGGGPVVLACE